MTKSRYQLIEVYPYSEFPYHVGIIASTTEIDRLLEMEYWVQERCGDLGSIYDNETQWFISWALEGMVTFGFRNREAAFKFKMTFQ